jgi:hypothetical protein
MIEELRQCAGPMHEVFDSCKREDEPLVGRLVSAFVSDEGCSASSDGIVSGLEGASVCELEERRTEEAESCGS